MELLKQLYCIHSPFYKEWPMICFIREYIRQHVPEAEVQMDSWGNLYIRKCADSSLFTLHFLLVILRSLVILIRFRNCIAKTSVSRRRMAHSTAGAKRISSARA